MQVPSPPRAATVLVADDDDDIRRAIVEVLEEEELLTIEAHDGEEALRLARSSRPDVIMLDYKMPGKTGADVASELRAQGVSVPIIFMTAGKDVQLAGCFLRKPFGIDQLVTVVRRALEGGC